MTKAHQRKTKKQLYANNRPYRTKPTWITDDHKQTTRLTKNVMMTNERKTIKKQQNMSASRN